MARRKCCDACMSLYEEGHWAFGRDRCPSCGGQLRVRAGQGEAETEFTYEHYDSSTDIHFDLEDLMSSAQLKENRLAIMLGVSLLLVAGVVRLGWVILDKSGGWMAPLWLEVLVGAMVFLACGILVWSIRRVWRHQRALKRG